MNDESMITIPYQDYRKLLSAINTWPQMHELLSNIQVDLETIVNYVEMIHLKLEKTDNEHGG